MINTDAHRRANAFTYILYILAPTHPHTHTCTYTDSHKGYLVFTYRLIFSLTDDKLNGMRGNIGSLLTQLMNSRRYTTESRAARPELSSLCIKGEQSHDCSCRTHLSQRPVWLPHTTASEFVKKTCFFSSS